MLDLSNAQNLQFRDKLQKFYNLKSTKAMSKMEFTPTTCYFVNE